MNNAQGGQLTCYIDATIQQLWSFGKGRQSTSQSSSTSRPKVRSADRSNFVWGD